MEGGGVPAYSAWPGVTPAGSIPPPQATMHTSYRRRSLVASLPKSICPCTGGLTMGTHEPAGSID